MGDELCYGCLHPVKVHGFLGCLGKQAIWCPCLLTPEELALNTRPDTPKCTCSRTLCEIHVQCDAKCQALHEPQTGDELRNALEHWKNHSVLGGCSHGC